MTETIYIKTTTLMTRDDFATVAAVGDLAGHAQRGGDLRHPPAPWTVDTDESSAAPWFWVAKLPAGTIFCQAEKHEPLEVKANGRCSWCGTEHQGEVTMFTFMDSGDY